MRAIAFFVALIGIEAAGWGAPFRIHGAMANYDTATQAFDVRIVTNQYPDMNTGIFQMWLKTPGPGIDNTYFLSSVSRTESWEFDEVIELYRGNWFSGNSLGQVDSVIQPLPNGTYALDISFDAGRIGLPDDPAEFDYQAGFFYGKNIPGVGPNDTFEGRTTVDDPVFVSEPSTLALAFLSVLVPFTQNRIRKRHSRTKSVGLAGRAAWNT